MSNFSDQPKKPLSDHALDQLFREARTYNSYADTPLSTTQIQSIYDLMKWGATSANCQPARVLFLTSNEAKERLKPYLAEGNVEKSMQAPCVAIIGHDLKFYDNLGEQFPHTDAKSWFVGNPQLIAETAFRNGSLQGAYLMLAARALGFDCGPMSGFDKDGVTRTFFAGSETQANFICTIGIGTEEGLHPRGPRLAFDQACQIL